MPKKETGSSFDKNRLRNIKERSRSFQQRPNAAAEGEYYTPIKKVMI